MTYPELQDTKLRKKTANQLRFYRQQRDGAIHFQGHAESEIKRMEYVNLQHYWRHIISGFRYALDLMYA